MINAMQPKNQMKTKDINLVKLMLTIWLWMMQQMADC